MAQGGTTILMVFQMIDTVLEEFYYSSGNTHDRRQHYLNTHLTPSTFEPQMTLITLIKPTSPPWRNSASSAVQMLWMVCKVS